MKRLPTENRRLAMMELLLAHPEMTGKEIGAAVGLSPSRTATIMQDETFQMAFEEYRRQHMEKVSDVRAVLDAKIRQATQVAIDESVKIMQTEGETVPIVIKQKSITDILGQGHAKATERKFDAHVAIPEDVVRGLFQVAKDMQTPIIPVRRLVKPHEEDTEIIEVSTD